MFIETLESRTHLSVGDPDTSFAGGGQLTFDDFAARQETLLIDEGDKLLINTEHHVYRINEDGSADTAFGNNGAVVDAGFNPVDVRLAPDGKIVIAGTLNNQFAVARYNDDGSLDSTFGDGGVATAPPPANHQLGADDLVVQADGKIVVGGESIDPSINVDADKEDIRTTC